MSAEQAVRSANALDLKLGQRVRMRRLEIGMSQERLAELLGVTFQQVQKYEKGVNRIAASRLVAIAKALKLEAHSFFEGLTPHTPVLRDAIGREAVLSTAEGVELIRLFASVKSQKVRRRIVDLVRTLADTK